MSYGPSQKRREHEQHSRAIFQLGRLEVNTLVRGPHTPSIAPFVFMRALYTAYMKVPTCELSEST